MIRDRVFYPSAILLAGLLIFLALQPGIGALPTGPVSVGDENYRTVTVSGLQLNRLLPGGDAEVDLVEDGAASVTQISVNADTLSEDPLLGPHFPLAADIEIQYSGFTIDVTVSARAGGDEPARQMRVNYSTGRNGESGWQVFDLTSRFEDHTFRYDVRLKSGAQGLDYLGIRPVLSGARNSIDVQSVTINRRGRWAQ